MTGISHKAEIITSSGRRHTGLALAALCLASFMASLDLFVVNVALRDIGIQFGGNALSNASWVLNAYSIFFGALLIPAGRMADHFGRRRVFIAGLAVFTLASLACALSPDFWALVGFRCLQAAGAAALVPSSLGLVLTTMPADRVAHGVRIWAVTGSVAGATGPVVGGLLTQVDWRWIFVLNLPVGVIAAIATALVVPDAKADRPTTIPSPLETLMIIVSLGALSVGIVEGSAWGWGSARIIVAWLVTAAAIALFFLLNSRAKAPVINLALFRGGVFSSANAGMVLLSVSIAMEILGMSLYLQQGWHWSAMQTGLAIAPGPVFLFLTSQVLARLRTPMTTWAMTATGFLVLGAGEALFTVSIHYMPGSHNYAAVILPGWILTGIGAGFSLPTLTGSATVGLPAHESAVGSAVIQVSRQLGSVLGTAVLTALLGSAIETGSTPQFLRAWWIATGVCVIGGISALGLSQRKPATIAPLIPPPEGARAAPPDRAFTATGEKLGQ
jgi:EmrB/QacA subfamily drug resistance transporter